MQISCAYYNANLIAVFVMCAKRNDGLSRRFISFKSSAVFRNYPASASGTTVGVSTVGVGSGTVVSGGGVGWQAPVPVGISVSGHVQVVPSQLPPELIHGAERSGVGSGVAGVGVTSGVGVGVAEGVGAGVAVSSGSSEGVGVGVGLVSGTASVSAVSGSSLYSELVSGSVLIRPSGTPMIFGIAASGFGRSSSVM